MYKWLHISFFQFFHFYFFFPLFFFPFFLSLHLLSRSTRSRLLKNFSLQSLPPSSSNLPPTLSSHPFFFLLPPVGRRRQRSVRAKLRTPEMLKFPLRTGPVIPFPRVHALGVGKRSPLKLR
ncbi:unnamed protein product [Cuscuta epithymum]|uniref:Transmembrane protein n=1 Tax=Cuscuta epithymum TaxID=186058 RepID=A0AAV0D1G1_9ASTE|nr:unnamed protein product [Cuscuta epithymum]